MKKPACKIGGNDGNVFTIIANVYNCLKREKRTKEAQKFESRTLSAESYDKILDLASEYVEIV